MKPSPQLDTYALYGLASLILSAIIVVASIISVDYPVIGAVIVLTSLCVAFKVAKEAIRAIAEDRTYRDEISDQ